MAIEIALVTEPAKTLTETDEKWLRRSFEIAKRAVKAGNHPFGALLVDPDGTDVLLEGENTVDSENDCTGHSEMNVIRQASRIFEPDLLAKCTIYASTEPCPMCAGAIYWSGIGRVVYGLSAERLTQIVEAEAPSLDKPLVVSSHIILEQSGKPVTVIGPALEDEASIGHVGVWQRLTH